MPAETKQRTVARQPGDAYNGIMKLAKDIFYNAFLKTGLVHAKHKWLPRRSLTVLGYHQVSTPDCLRDTMGWEMTAEAFREQMQYIVAHYHPISGKELEGIIARNWPVPANAVAVTFDDGYRDVYDVAFPIMKELNIPGIVFLTTGPPDTGQSIWTNIVYYYFYLTRKNQVQLKLPDGTTTGCRWRNAAEKRQCILQLNQKLKNIPQDDMSKVLSVLATALEIAKNPDPVDLLPMLTWEQVQELQDSQLFTIGSHTVNHRILSGCSEAVQKKELIDSKARIEYETQVSCNLLAYPNGQADDVTRETVELARSVGYTAAFMFSPVSPYPDIPAFNAPRHPIMTADLAEFAWRLA